MPQINFNGKTYSSLDEMPANEREAYLHIMALFKDANQNGVPDIFEGDLRKNIVTALTTSVRMVDGNQVYTPQNMPPEVRAKYEKAMAKLQQLGLTPGVPAAENISFSSELPSQQAQQPAQSQEFISSAPIPQSPSVVQEDTGPNMALIIVGVVMVLMVLAGAAGVFIFLMNR